MKNSKPLAWSFSAIFAFGELNLHSELNWLTPAKLPAGSCGGEYNLAAAARRFSCEAIMLPPRAAI